MSRNMNGMAHDKLKGWFEGKLREGKFPEVEFREGGGMKGYNMMEYSRRWCRAAMVFERLVASVNPEFSILNGRLRSKAYAEALDISISRMTPEIVAEDGERFKSFLD